MGFHWLFELFVYLGFYSCSEILVLQRIWLLMWNWVLFALCVNFESL